MMAEIRTVTTLRRKEADIVRTIDAYEARLRNARADLSHVRAIIRLFEAKGGPNEVTPYTDINRLYRYAEMGNICLEALKAGPLTTPQLAVKLAEAKDFDLGDKVLLHKLTERAIASMRSMELRGKVVEADRVSKKRRMILWKLS